ncbi:tRNA (adenosine(37)-N6)-threonylcarbamoyltransferase complex dimerization subunit type 1 TsaB [Myroides indicus]|uniref:tRNA threonylcarbamoyladenosine biosynthesis protein TsaB n=1 Tax=Myroides indicus TaxID=1323422 RepID=A0A4R7F4H8_9FLAO|nr:tRNA (adenosine(37)-N6)-threonylcarbamoyltransferase complex dimerization subunit type 1 TsaB [Myroides indicus]TDS63577.1 tRNA threonylcarbamoyladenosine biosynthesis protein TsaB [Myroides indicus]
MSTILSIETATKNCSVSLSVNGKLEICREIAEENFSHAEKLHVFIEEILADKRKEIKDLNAIAVSYGPGSYTGLRIGVSSAKGLCYGLNIPLIALDTLEILARQLVVENGLIIPMLDARRMEVFCSVFDKDYNCIQSVEAKIVDENSFAELKNDELNIHFIGDGAAKCKSIFTDDQFIFHDEIIHPSAKNMSAMAFEKYQKGEFADVAYFEPYYLKDFVLPGKKK